MQETKIKTLALAAALAVSTAFAAQAADRYTLDSSHSQIVFSYNHLAYSTTYGMFSGFEGEILFDQDNPAASSVEVSMPASSMFTGWEARDAHFTSADFLNVAEHDVISFVSTGIEVTGDDTALITGDLTMNGTTKPIVLDAKLNQFSEHPVENVRWAGFDATTTLLRSDFGMGAFAPFVSDEVEVMISIEAQIADSQEG